MPGLSVEQLESHRSVIHRVCFRMLGSEQEAEDATQDTFARAIPRLKQYRGEASPATWLCCIAQTVCLSRLKKDRPRRLETSLDDPDQPEPADPAADPQTETERDVYLRQLLCGIRSEARSRVPPWDQVDYLVFEAYFLGERKSWPEVGLVLAMNPETAKYHYYNHVLPALRAVGQRFSEALTSPPTVDQARAVHKVEGVYGNR